MVKHFLPWRFKDTKNIDIARAIYYNLFGTFFTINNENYDETALIKNIQTLSLNPLDENSQIAFENLKKLFFTPNNNFETEVNEVFFSPYSTFIPVTASYYLEDRDDGKKRLEMIEFLLGSKFRKDEFSELEDHIGFVMLFMQNLLNEGSACSVGIAKSVFEKILNPFIDEFIEVLYLHPDAKIFKEIAVLLRSFVAFERVYLVVVAPPRHESRTFIKDIHKKRKPNTPRPIKNLDEMVL